MKYLNKLLLASFVLLSSIIFTGCFDGNKIDIVKKLNVPFNDSKTYLDFANTLNEVKWKYDESTNNIKLIGVYSESKRINSNNTRRIEAKFDITITLDENNQINKIYWIVNSSVTSSTGSETGNLRLTFKDNQWNGNLKGQSSRKFGKIQYKDFNEPQTERVLKTFYKQLKL